MNAIEIQEMIELTGHLPGGTDYVEAIRVLRGPKDRRGTERDESARLTEDHAEFGTHPEGFLNIFRWNRQHDRIRIGMFLNAQDVGGLCIQNVRRHDLLQVSSATGIAAFAANAGSDDIFPSIIAAIGAVGEALVPDDWDNAVTKGTELATNLYRKVNPPDHKKRDAWGTDPSTGHRAHAEGGVLVATPGAHGPYYSGNGDNKHLWIQGDGERCEANYPQHFLVGTAYFLRRSSILPLVEFNQDGEVYFTAWDHAFPDNAGYYYVEVVLMQGSACPAYDVRIKRGSAWVFANDRGYVGAMYGQAFSEASGNAHLAKFRCVEIGDGRVALFTHDNRCIEVAENGTLRADNHVIEHHAQFEIVNGNLLKAYNNRYLEIDASAITASAITDASSKLATLERI